MDRYREHGELGLLDRPSVPHHSRPQAPAEGGADRGAASGPEVVRRPDRTRAGQRGRDDLGAHGRPAPGSARPEPAQVPRPERREQPGTAPIIARWPGHMVHVDVKKVGRIPDGGGWRVHGRGSDQAKKATGPRQPAPAPATSTCIRSSTASPASPTPRRCPTRRPRPQSGSCAGQESSSPPTASPTSTGWSPTTGPATARTSSRRCCTPLATSGSPRTRPGTTARSSATTAPSPRSSSTPANGPANNNAPSATASGTSTTTTIDPTLPSATGRPRANSRPASPTSWPRTPRSVAILVCWRRTMQHVRARLVALFEILSADHAQMP